MLNPQKAESQATSPADLIGSVQEYPREGEPQAATQHAFHFIAEGHPLEQCSFEQLGLTAFDPDKLDWWFENESASKA